MTKRPDRWTERPANHDRIGSRQLTVLRTVADRSGPITKAEVKGLLTRPGEHRNTLYSALRRLCDRGFLVQAEDGYEITAKGQSALAE